VPDQGLGFDAPSRPRTLGRGLAQPVSPRRALLRRARL